MNLAPRTSLLRRGRALVVALSLALTLPGLSRAAGDVAPLPPESIGAITLPAVYPPHWVWVGDISFFHMSDGRAYLVDADSGRFKGQLSAGGFFQHLNLPRTRPEIYTVSTYYERLTRGARSDVLTIYDPKTLAPLSEVMLPPKRHTGMPMLGYQALTDAERFLAVMNMTPAQSVSVVDLHERRVSAEIPTPGCSMLYASGARRFHLLCARGGLLTVQLTPDGTLARSTQSEPFFDAARDPLMEKARRVGDRWVHISFAGDVYTIVLGADAPRFEAPWPLSSEAERAAAWRPGGLMPLAAHVASEQIFVLMHQGGADTHKDPGSEVWVYDLKTRKRLRRIPLSAGLATSIQVTQDDAPLLLATFVAKPALEVYDLASGSHQRTIAELGETPIVIQTYREPVEPKGAEDGL